MAGDLKVNISYSDGGTITDEGIVRNEGMNIFDVGELVAEGTIGVGEGVNGWPIVWESGSFNANTDGVWVFIKNISPGLIELQINLTVAERSGSDYEWITMGKLKPGPTEGSTDGEFIWMYMASPYEVSGDENGVARGIRVRNMTQPLAAYVQYGIYSR